MPFVSVKDYSRFDLVRDLLAARGDMRLVHQCLSEFEAKNRDGRFQLVQGIEQQEFGPTMIVGIRDCNVAKCFGRRGIYLLQFANGHLRVPMWFYHHCNESMIEIANELRSIVRPLP